MDLIPPSEGSGGATPYRVLARKYRPQSFSDLVGQEPMVRTLTNAFASGRLAQAYILTGVRGVGKTTTARILARALNYRRPGEPDRPSIDFTVPGEHCAAIMEGRHVDVIEMDAASHTGIGDIREIIESVRYKPALARYKVYIIDEVHMLSNQAFNGLLKTLEEPPEHVKFVFATTEIRKVPVTVLSRCQRFDLRRIDAERLVGLLSDILTKESLTAEPAALAMIARAAEGSARDALSILDQAIAHGGLHVTGEAVRAMLGLAERGRVIDLFAAVMRGDAAGALGLLADLHAIGADPTVVLEELANFTHLVTRLRIIPDAVADPSLTEEERTRGVEFAAGLSIRVLSRAWQMLLKGIEEAQASERPLAAADMVIVRLAHAADLPTPDEALRALRDGAATAAGAPAQRLAATLLPNPPPQGGREPPGFGAGSSAPGTSPLAGEVGSSRASGSIREGGGPTTGFSFDPRAAGLAATPLPSPPPQGGREPVGAASAVRAVAAQPVTPARTAAALQAQPAAQPAPAPDTRPQPQSIEDLVAIAAANRDLPMKIALERQVRPIRFEAGRLEIAVTPEAPASLTGDLSRRLQEWTGRRWLVTVGNGPAEPTLAERRAAAQTQLVNNARENPLAAAVLARFPGAEIVDVRIRGEAPAQAVSADEPPPWEPDEERD